eukprot:scaffold142636_cov196-Phaeocystis_antarctica.AAC.1
MLPRGPRGVVEGGLGTGDWYDLCVCSPSLAVSITSALRDFLAHHTPHDIHACPPFCQRAHHCAPPTTDDHDTRLTTGPLWSLDTGLCAAET